jgi:hypothetical protein
MLRRAGSVVFAVLAIGAVATMAAWGAAPTAATGVLPIANRAYQATVAYKLPRSIGQNTFILKASASRTRVSILDANVNVLCTHNGGVANPPVGVSTVAVSPTGAFKFSLGRPALVIVGRFVTRTTATGRIAYTVSSNPGTCSLKAPWRAILIPRTVAERYVGKTATGAKVRFSVTHPANKPASLSVGNFAVGNVLSTCSAEGGGGTREISFEDGSVGRVKNGHFSNGDGAPASSSDEDLGFVASGRLTGNSASGVVGATDPSGCGYGPIHWTAKRVP